MAGRPEHDPVARGLPESGVGRAVVPSDVGLDLDDPADSPAGLVVTDQARAQQRPPGLERGPGQCRSIDQAQPDRG